MQRIETDVLVIGSGVAGLSAAVAAREDPSCRVLVLDKGLFGRSGSTVGAEQIACTGPWSLPGDGPDVHFSDTVVGSQFLADQRLVRVMVDEASERIQELMRWGLKFDRRADGSYILAMINGHAYPRSLCCRADNTGLAMSQSMKRVARQRGVEVLEETLATRLLRRPDRLAGVAALDMRSGELVAIQATATVLATGGMGQVFSTTTNPAQCTADGQALVLRAGLPLQDMEMEQFLAGLVHPPALRGYGVGMIPFGKLYNGDGERYMARYNPGKLEDATRDTIGYSMGCEMRAGRTGPHGGVFLDAMGLDEDVYALFESSFRVYAAAGLDPRHQQLEIGPSAHYSMGGVPIDVDGLTELPGLLAAGEVTAGIHGANRLGNNSLTDGLVFGARAGHAAREMVASGATAALPDADLADEQRHLDDVLERRHGSIRPIQVRERLRDLMWSRVGVLRSHDGLKEARQVVDGWIERLPREVSLRDPSRLANRELVDYLELENMLLSARAVIHAALFRTESRGAHHVEEFPEQDDTNWLKNTVLRLDQDGAMRLTTRDAVLTELWPQAAASTPA